MHAHWSACSRAGRGGRSNVSTVVRTQSIRRCDLRLRLEGAVHESLEWWRCLPRKSGTALARLVRSPLSASARIDQPRTRAIGRGVRLINTEPLIAHSIPKSSASVRSAALPVEVVGRMQRRGRQPVPANHHRRQHSPAPASRSLDQLAACSASIPMPRCVAICSVTASAQME